MDSVNFALDELDGSDFAAIREHSATLRAHIARLSAPSQEVVEVLREAQEGLRNFCCSAGEAVPCLRDCGADKPEHCDFHLASQAFCRIDALLTKLGAA